VREQLLALAELYATDELMIVTITHDRNARRRSYELLAGTFDLQRHSAERHPSFGVPPSFEG
jgi:hypothetical protein